MDIRMVKNKLRAEYRQKRTDLPRETKEEYDSRIADVFCRLISYKYASQVLFYASTPDEISTEKIFQNAIRDGKACYFPRCYAESKMKYFRAYSLDELKEDAFNIKAPLDSAEEYTPQPSDICIVPAMAYDKKGYRLGYGKGFYDRFLSGFDGIKVGFCYKDFLVPDLPKGRFDVSVDLLVTQDGVVSL